MNQRFKQTEYGSIYILEESFIDLMYGEFLPGYYFVDEVWLMHGPFNTIKDCQLGWDRMFGYP